MSLTWSKYALMAFLMCWFSPVSSQQTNVVRIGAIFTEQQRNSPMEIAFKYAVYRINLDDSILPNITLVHIIKYTPDDNSFIATKLACELAESRVMAIFGPMDSYLAPHVHSICDTLDIPHVESHLSVEAYAKEFSLNVYPHPPVMNEAYNDIMVFLNWTKVLIIFEEEVGLIKLQDLIRSPLNTDLEVIVRQGSPDNFRDILKEIKARDVFNLIVGTKPESMATFLRAILQMQMNDYKYHYLFATYDIETFNLEDFKYNFVNITAFRLVNSHDFHAKKIIREMEEFQPINNKIIEQHDIIKANSALLYDSVLVFAQALAAFSEAVGLQSRRWPSCKREVPWSDGSSFFNYLNMVKEIRGLTGPIEFNGGKRTTFKLDLLKLKQQDLVKVGEWTPTGRVNITDQKAFYDPGTLNVTLIVTTNLDSPYVMLKENSNLTGNDRFEGFCVDLLRAIANFVGFNYSIVLNPDGMYGVKNKKTGEWNGLVRQLIDKKADLAVGSMSISYARESVIDFTKPFMNLGISILFKVPTSQETRLFSFMNPLAVNIWLYMIVAYGMVSLTMFIVARFSPYEWRSPHPCLTESGLIENQFSIGNSFWFTIGTLMQQGSDLNPKAISTRIVGGIWWFFTLIIISSYTANLAAFLTVERMITPIESAEDLAEQSDINYGTLEGGSTMTFFRDSKIDTYKKMWRFMESKKPGVFTKSYEEGIARVLEGNYAFLAESTTIDYIVNRNCNLTQIGGLLDSKGFGIGTTIGSPWRDPISLAILELQEKAVIHTLYNKWWKDTSGSCNRNDKNSESKASELGVANIGGVFVVLLCGLAFAILVAIIEFCWNARRNAQVDKQSLCSEMMEELRFAVRCHASHQRPALTRQCDRCVPVTGQLLNRSLDMLDTNSCEQNSAVPGSTAAQMNGECAVPSSTFCPPSDQMNDIMKVASYQPISIRRRM